MLLILIANLRLADLSTSRKPVIIGAPPPYDSKLTHAMRLFSNGKIDYDGPARLPNLAATRIKKQMGGGKVTRVMARDSDSEDDERMSTSSSPTPRKLRPRKGLQVIVPTATRKRLPSIISLSSSGSEGSNVGREKRDVSGEPSDEEQVLPTRKRKAKSQHFPRAEKRVALPDRNCTPHADPNSARASIQATKKTRLTA